MEGRLQNHSIVATFLVSIFQGTPHLVFRFKNNNNKKNRKTHTQNICEKIQERNVN